MSRIEDLRQELGDLNLNDLAPGPDAVFRMWLLQLLLEIADRLDRMAEHRSGTHDQYGH